MEHLKSFRNGQSASWQIEDIDGCPQPVMYVDGERIGVIWPCLNMDADGNRTQPQVVDGKTLVAYVRHGDKTYWLVDSEYDPVRRAREAATASRRAADKAAWESSDAGRQEAERHRKEREWDTLYNEGGDGYNPYRRDIDAEVEGTEFDRRDRHYPDGA